MHFFFYAKDGSWEGAALVVRELRLPVRIDRGADFLSHLTTPECLDVSYLAHVAPIASLARLRRLGLPVFEGDAGELLSTLVSSPCAAKLEALFLDMRYSRKVSSWRLELLSSLVNLREFGLHASAKSLSSGDDVETMAGALADHPTLAVLDLIVPEALAAAVLRRGFPSNMKVLWILGSSNVEFGALVTVLPRDLSAFRWIDGGRRSSADIRALLSRCPQLRAFCLLLDNAAIEYLASRDVDRPLLLGRHCFPDWVDYDAPTAAGHVVGSLDVGFHWRVAGGVVFEGKAVAV